MTQIANSRTEFKHFFFTQGELASQVSGKFISAQSFLPTHRMLTTPQTDIETSRGEKCDQCSHDFTLYGFQVIACVQGSTTNATNKRFRQDLAFHLEVSLQTQFQKSRMDRRCLTVFDPTRFRY